jgi:hypothetical protein
MQFSPEFRCLVSVKLKYFLLHSFSEQSQPSLCRGVTNFHGRTKQIVKV